MGFTEYLGGCFGRLKAKAEDMNAKLNVYMAEYECLDNTSLKDEYQLVKARSTEEERLRCEAIKRILRQRGVIE